VAGGSYDQPARWFAARGYAGLVVDLLGTGDSDGIRRPEFDPGDADDGIAAIEWAAAQPWCDGAVGMWGLSYAANVALRTASRRPPALGGLIAVAHGPRDPVWRERAVDGAAIVTPALCVGGWRDAFPDGLVDAYERIAGPKKL